MKRIGVTQRVSTQFHGQPHDCLDQAWADLLGAIGYEIAPLPNLAADGAAIGAYLNGQGLDALILSGGNDIAGLGDPAGSQASPRRDTFERAAISWARGRRLPLLGVCRGMQFLNVVLGGSLVRVEGHAGTRHELTRAPGPQPAYFGALPDRFEANSFHNFAVAAKGLAPGLKAAAIDEDGLVEAFFHPDEPLAAIMWHPERERPTSAADRAVLMAIVRSSV
ncbi:MAG: gamma-glutamyl-gamma-aminobutyrate hydrolase family protein [Maricaulaceae bacterium]|nr:gamma-glutamyl-gamma-aminobutyrate hydrolase family protein [Maricaulaceae bacterium]